jgi:hypothetical protein
MTAVQVIDREGLSQTLDVKLLSQGQEVYVFMSDRTSTGNGLLARNAAVYIPQLLDRFQLDPADTVFFRHVYLPAQGSLFGRYQVVWRERTLASYNFSMLNNLGEGRRLKAWIEAASQVPISYAQTRNLSTTI